MKIRLTMLVMLAVFIFFVPVYAMSGLTPGGELIITTSGQLAEIQRQADLYVSTNGRDGSIEYLSKAYVLDADINLPEDWQPIGSKEYPFRGSLNGNGHKISGLTTEKAPHSGLFGRMEGAYISNLVLVDAKILLSGSPNGEVYAGLLVGEAANSHIFDVAVYGEISAGDVSHGYIGGLAGGLFNCLAERVYIDADIKSMATAGGVVGLSRDSDFYHTDGRGNVAGETAGGFAGNLEGNCIIRECSSNAGTTGKIAGGFAGQASGNKLTTNANHTIRIYNSQAMGKVVADAGIAGGFIGQGEYVLVSECFAAGDTGGGVAGGFVGRLSHRSLVVHSFAKGNVEHFGPVGFAGGFVGEITNSSCIEFAYASGAVVSNAHSAAVSMASDTNLENHRRQHIAENGFKPPVFRSVADVIFRDSYDLDFLAIGGFAGMVSGEGAPNTLTHCLSLAPWVVGPKNSYVNRFAGIVAQGGINGCYAHMGSMVVLDGALSHVLPSPFGADGADMSSGQVEDVAARLGWRLVIPTT